MSEAAMITVGIAAASATIGGIVWAVRIEGRVNAHELHHDNVRNSLEEQRIELRYIRERVDEIAKAKR